MVYEKSFSGQQELNNSQRALNARQRQVLIMIDGKRTQDDLARYLQNLDVAEIIADLERQGYIHTPGQRNPAAKNTATSSATPAPQSPASQPSPSPLPTPAAQIASAVSDDGRPLNSGTLAAVKVILSISAKEHLGLMGRAMVEKIEKIQDRTALLAVISQWHMAIRESKSGRATASVLIEEVHQLING
jgi:hypothetical protein